MLCKICYTRPVKSVYKTVLLENGDELRVFEEYCSKCSNDLDNHFKEDYTREYAHQHITDGVINLFTGDYDS